MDSHPVRLFLLVLLVPLALVSGCTASFAVGPSRGAAEGRVITTSEIRISGASNAWEAIERNGTPLRLESERRRAAPVEPSAGGLRSLPRVIVDGIQMFELRLLRDIPAHLISSIRILSGAPTAAASRETEERDGEVILIRTRNAPGR